MQDAIYITKDGLEKLKQELKVLREEKMPEVSKRIQIARDNGDISENAEYDASKHEQALLEGKVKELEDIIKNAKISEGVKGEISVGSKVKVHVEGEEMQLHIVGAMEANPTERKISHNSPIGSALVGKKIGDKVEVEAPIGKIVYTIISIE
jgi:transcription elongation factor GreA